jgi:hypothetical protein
VERREIERQRGSPEKWRGIKENEKNGSGSARRADIVAAIEKEQGRRS